MLTVPTNILVPTDFSPQAEAALDYACTLATKLGATVNLLSVLSIPALGVPELGAALTASAIADMVRDNQAALEKLADARRGKATIGKVLMRTGDARDVIPNVAEEIRADLLVMGTHGRRGLSRALLGSVTEYVVRVSNIPVLTVRGGKK